MRTAQTNRRASVGKELATMADSREMRVTMEPVENSDAKLVAALQWLLSLPGKKKEAA